jgi:starch-binding outer membrane protein, SusD/RagB family
MTILCSVRSRRQRAGRPRPLATRLTHHAALVVAPLLAGALASACKDSNVPLLTGPTRVASTPVGVQNAITGLFSAARNDVGSYVTFMSTFSRDAANFTNTEPRFITEGMGLLPISNTDQFFSASIWDIEFRNAKYANQIIATLPSVTPAYSAADAATITGVAQTMKALQFMMLAETRDTLGVSVYSIDGGSVPQPVFCNKDVWKYIVALLDSGNTALQVAGSSPIPLILPPGFVSVSAAAAPSTSPGAFAAFNRALAGKAGLEYAYAIARHTGGNAAPSPIASGAPDATALTRADSALHASALFNPAAITAPQTGGFTSDAFGVYHSWSPQSGDQLNPINGIIGTLAVLWDMVADADTVNDARWHAKFAVNPNAVQQLAFAPAASPYIYSYYPTVSTPIPIVRNEELTLVDAQIQLGLGNLGAATSLINTVHQQAGGFATPLVIAAAYTNVRDALLKEQRISTILEASGDRDISIRMYGMATVSDTTWNATSGPDAVAVASATAALGAKPVDLHTLVDPPPSTEGDGRGGSFTLTCSP